VLVVCWAYIPSGYIGSFIDSRSLSLSLPKNSPCTAANKQHTARKRERENNNKGEKTKRAEEQVFSTGLYFYNYYKYRPFFLSLSLFLRFVLLPSSTAIINGSPVKSFQSYKNVRITDEEHFIQNARVPWCVSKQVGPGRPGIQETAFHKKLNISSLIYQ